VPDFELDILRDIWSNTSRHQLPMEGQYEARPRTYGTKVV
jgi:hypothetical protein